MHDKFFRELSHEEIVAFQQWARDHYVPGVTPMSNLWHPVIREECRVMEAEARISPRRDNPVPNSYGELECQHGNPVPGVCASCDELYAPEDEGTGEE